MLAVQTFKHPRGGQPRKCSRFLNVGNKVEVLVFFNLMFSSGFLKLFISPYNPGCVNLNYNHLSTPQVWYFYIGFIILPPFRPKCRIADKVDSSFHQRKPPLCASSLRIVVVLSNGIKSLPHHQQCGI